MSQNKEPSKTLIYVSNLPFDTTDEQFKDLFKGFNVKTAYVAKRKNGKSKGFGFVNLEKESDQNAAIEKLNGKELNSRKLIARIAYNDERRTENGELKEEFKTQTNNINPPSETVVHVSNLAWTTTDEELRKIFAEFNPKSATVAMRKNGRSKGFGFVEFNNKEDREKALSLDQKTFSERQITVKVSTGYRGDKPRDSNRDNNRRNNRDNNNRDNNRRRNNNSSRRSKSPTKRSPSGNSSNSNNNNNNNNNRSERRASEFTIYIKNLPFELDETDLKDVFQEFRPTAANIPRRGGRSKGFGFVEFGNAKDQNDALRNLDQSEINGRVVSISISKGGSSSRDNNRDNNNNRRSPRRNRSSTRNNNNNNNRSDRRGSKTRSRGEKKSNATSELSKTNAYVSNIPFSINEKKLEEFFKDLKVNKCTIPRKRNGDSFGYAFVEFASIEDQQKAIKLNDTVVEGRKIVIQAAFHRTDSN